MNLSFGALTGSLLVSGVGFVYFNYGRKKSRPLYLGSGILMMVYPYFITDFFVMVGIAAVISAFLYWSSRRS